jgi:hypothetical protein
MLAELMRGMMSSSTPSPIFHEPKPSPMSEFKSTLRLFMLDLSWFNSLVSLKDARQTR